MDSASIERSSGILWSSASPVHETNAVGMQRTAPFGFSRMKAGEVGIPGGVAARLERRADAAGRERGGVGLALDQLLAGELGDRGAVARRGRRTSRASRRSGRSAAGTSACSGSRPSPSPTRASPWRRRRPATDRAAAPRGQRLLELAVDVLRQARLLDRGGERVLAVDLRAGRGQVGRAEGVAVRAPLRGAHVLLSGSAGHRDLEFLLRGFHCALRARGMRARVSAPNVLRMLGAHWGRDLIPMSKIAAARLARSSVRATSVLRPVRGCNRRSRPAGERPWRSFDTRPKRCPAARSRLPGHTRTTGGHMTRSFWARAGGVGPDGVAAGAAPSASADTLAERQSAGLGRHQHDVGAHRRRARDVHAGRLRVPGDRLLPREERRHDRREDLDELLDRRAHVLGGRLRVRVRR